METKTEKKKDPRKLLSIFGIGLSLVGIADATYLTIAHYTTSTILACPDTGIINCEKVTSSSYSEILGIPVPILGLVFFVTMLVLQSPMMWRSKNRLIVFGRAAFAVTGLLSVFWFIFVEFHRLDAICLYCTLVHILTFGLFVNTIIGTSLVTNDK